MFIQAKNISLLFAFDEPGFRQSSQFCGSAPQCWVFSVGCFSPGDQTGRAACRPAWPASQITRMGMLCERCREQQQLKKVAFRAHEAPTLESVISHEACRKSKRVTYRIHLLSFKREVLANVEFPKRVFQNHRKTHGVCMRVFMYICNTW